jgi:hypothetical protein
MEDHAFLKKVKPGSGGGDPDWIEAIVWLGPDTDMVMG